jgi:chloramphenicol-sensitive protein RarD
VETLFVSPVAVGYIVFLMATGASTFGGNGGWHVVLVMGTGLITVIPLLCFGGAATRIPLSTLGLMQYLTPSVQFLLGIVVFHEPMPAMRLVGFCLIWLSLAIFTFETLRHHRRQVRQRSVETVTA